MKLELLVLFILVIKTCFCNQISQRSALYKALLDGYEKDAKPDGKIEVKTGMEVVRIDGLCPYKEVYS